MYKGRARVLTGVQVAQNKQWVDDGVPKGEAARCLGIGQTILYTYLSPQK